MTKNSGHHIPTGIRVLINYTVLLIFFYLIFGLVLPGLMGMSIISTSPYILLTNIFTLIAMTVLVIGFLKRKEWSWKLAFFLYTLSIINNLLVLFYIKYSILNLISDFVKASFIFALFLNMMTIWYLYERKDYFMHKEYHPHVHLADKVFISAIYIFYFFAILFVVALGFEFYKSATYTVDVIADDLRGKTFQESLTVCNSLDYIDRDVCFLSVATIHSKFEGSRQLCSKIFSDFYKLACYQATM